MSNLQTTPSLLLHKPFLLEALALNALLALLAFENGLVLIRCHIPTFAQGFYPSGLTGYSLIPYS